MPDIDIRAGLSREERLRLEKIDKLDSNKRRKKVIIAVVTIILILFFILGTFFGAKHILSYEGTEALPPEEIIYPEIPYTPEDIVSSFKKMLKETKNFGGVKLNVDFDVKIVDESIEITGENGEAVSPALDYIKSSFVSALSSEYDSQRYEGEYGDDFSSALFSTQYLAHSVDIYWDVSSEDENDLKYIFDYNEDTISVPAGEVVFRKIFDVDSDTAAFTALKEKTASMVNTDNAVVTYEDFIMIADIDRLNEKLESVQQKRVLNVTIPMTFIGEYEALGAVDVKFTLELYKTFSFSRVEMFFKDDVYYIEKGSTDEFKYKVVTDQSASEIEVKLTSSDPSVLSIDGSFYKGEKVSADPVTVTATYTYNGITYEDTCLYYVRVPVEGVKVNIKEKSLKVGETASLTANISPVNATLKTAYWFTSDDSVAQVDEDGLITAVSAGVASVYCITLDGNYKSVCTVTVTE